MSENLLMFVLYDRASKTYTNPMFFPTYDSAIRSILPLFNDKSSSYHLFPEHFRFYCIGSYSVDTAFIDIFPQQRLICDGNKVVYSTDLFGSNDDNDDDDFFGHRELRSEHKFTELGLKE